jgi:hypothetical protein
MSQFCGKSNAKKRTQRKHSSNKRFKKLASGSEEEYESPVPSRNSDEDMNTLRFQSRNETPIVLDDRFYGFNKETRKIARSYHKLLKDPMIKEDILKEHVNFEAGEGEIYNIYSMSSEFLGPNSTTVLGDTRNVSAVNSQDKEPLLFKDKIKVWFVRNVRANILRNKTYNTPTKGEKTGPIAGELTSNHHAIEMSSGSLIDSRRIGFNDELRGESFNEASNHNNRYPSLPQNYNQPRLVRSKTLPNSRGITAIDGWRLLATGILTIFVVTRMIFRVIDGYDDNRAHE